MCASDVSFLCTHFSVRPTRDCFASALNARFSTWWTVDDDAFTKDWRAEGCCWMNPPWELLDKVVVRLEEVGPEAVLLAPRFEQFAWWGKLIASGAASRRVTPHDGMFGRFGTDPVRAPP